MVPAGKQFDVNSFFRDAIRTFVLYDLAFILHNRLCKIINKIMHFESYSVSPKDFSTEKIASIIHYLSPEKIARIIHYRSHCQYLLAPILAGGN